MLGYFWGGLGQLLGVQDVPGMATAWLECIKNAEKLKRNEVSSASLADIGLLSARQPRDEEETAVE